MTTRGRRQSGCFVAEGFRLLERALAAGLAPRRVLLSTALRASPEQRIQHLLARLEKMRSSSSSLSFAPPETLQALTEGRTFGDIFALLPLPPPPDLADLLLEEVAARKKTRLLVAEEVQEPGNIGALSRTALALGASALVLLGGTDPFHPKAVRTSKGSLFLLPLLRFSEPQELFQLLRAYKVQRAGAVPQGGTPLQRVSLEAPRLALFVGGEAHGLSPTLLSQMDRLVTIPMSAPIDSLSLNAASAIFLYAASPPPAPPPESETDPDTDPVPNGEKDAMGERNK